MLAYLIDPEVIILKVGAWTLTALTVAELIWLKVDHLMKVRRKRRHR